MEVTVHADGQKKVDVDTDLNADTEIEREDSGWTLGGDRVEPRSGLSAAV